MFMGKKGLTKKDVEHVAKLSQLKLTSAETTKFQKQLSKVIDYVDELSEVDTSGVEPTSQTTGLTNVLREDKLDPKQGLTVEEALSGTEKSHNNYFVVPYVNFIKND